MDYNKCLINIEAIDARIISDFSKLHETFGEWIKNRDDGLRIPSVNIIKYIVACYDKESPIVQQYKQRWTVKKREAAKISGILEMREEAGSEIDDILYCRNEEINKVTVRYLAVLSDRDFLTYAIYNEVLVNQSKQLLGFDFSKPSEVAVAKTNVENIQNDIQLLEQKLFSGDDVRALKNILQEEANKFMISELRPENLVTKNEKGEQVIASPYGDDYELPKLKFLDDQ